MARARSKIASRALASVALLCASCGARPTHLYEGPRRPPEELATLEATRPFTAAVIGIDSRKVSGSVWYLAAGDHRVWSETRARGRAGAGSFTVWTFCLFRWHAAPGERYELLPAVEVQETGVLDKNVSVGAFLREASTNRVVHPSGCTGKRPRLER